jgi:hypothetical protein
MKDARMDPRILVFGDRIADARISARGVADLRQIGFDRP